MAVIDPVKLIIDNYPEDKEEWLETENNPEDENAGTRKVPFSKELYIERSDFKEEAGSKFFRLTIGKEVRLKSAYIIKGEKALKNSDGEIIEIHCTYDPESLSGSETEASLRKVKGTLHWVSVKHAINVEVREYDRLFMDESPDSHVGKTFMDFLNPNSLKTSNAFTEPSLKDAAPGNRFQFQRLGYFNVDDDSTANHLIFNKTVGLRDSWEKVKPKKEANQNQPRPQQQKRRPIDVIKQLGKKYTNLPEEKQIKVKAEIQELAESIAYEDLHPMFNTAAKKVGTRIATTLALGVLLKNGLRRNDDIDGFIERALDDKNPLLAQEAKAL
jgi:glutaminyl-tRNA synthetase